MINKGKIELKEPYKSFWKYGYIVINKEPRRNVILYNSNKDRTTVSYARYLYETSINKFLPPNVIVDHIDGNQLNDDLTNYQVISITENIIKANKQNNTTQQLVELKCGTCGNIFIKPRNHTHLVIKKNSTYCSRKCSGKHIEPSLIIREFRE